MWIWRVDIDQAALGMCLDCCRDMLCKVDEEGEELEGYRAS